MFLVRRDGTRVDLGQIGPSRSASGVTVRGVAYRCGNPELPGEIVELRCELPVGHEGPVMPRWRHVGRDRHGEWHTWETDPSA